MKVKAGRLISEQLSKCIFQKAGKVPLVLKLAKHAHTLTTCTSTHNCSALHCVVVHKDFGKSLVVLLVKAGNFSIEALAQVFATAHPAYVKCYACTSAWRSPTSGFRQDIRHLRRSWGWTHPLSALREALGLL